LNCFRDAGQFSIYAGTDPKHVSEIVDLMLEEIRRIKSEAVPADELERAKSHMRGSILMSLESTGSRMSQIARMEMTEGRHVTPEETIASVEAVSSEDVLRLAKEMFDGRSLAMTVLGRLEHFDPVPESLVA
jgi:predicted Zn-dependent peptidase